MANDLYVDRNVADRMRFLTESESAELLDKLELVRENPLQNSVSLPQAPDLRTVESGNHRVILTYSQPNHLVIVTDLDDLPTTNPQVLAANPSLPSRPA